MRGVVRTLEDWDAFGAKLSRKGQFTGKPLTVTVTEFRRPRTIDQNSKLHAMFHDLANHTGYRPSVIKDFFKSEFGPQQVVPIGKHDVVIAKSTTEYTLEELSEMIERVYQVGADCGCVFQGETQ